MVLKVNVDEVLLGLEVDDYSYLEIYPHSEYEIVEELSTDKGYKIVHIVKKGLQDRLPVEDYYMLSNTIKSPCEFFKVVEYEVV